MRVRGLPGWAGTYAGEVLLRRWSKLNWRITVIVSRYLLRCAIIYVFIRRAFVLQIIQVDEMNLSRLFLFFYLYFKILIRIIWVFIRIKIVYVLKLLFVHLIQAFLLDHRLWGRFCRSFLKNFFWLMWILRPLPKVGVVLKLLYIFSQQLLEFLLVKLNRWTLSC